jgi:hypothetical protein
MRSAVLMAALILPACVQDDAGSVATDTSVVSCSEALAPSAATPPASVPVSLERSPAAEATFAIEGATACGALVEWYLGDTSLPAHTLPAHTLPAHTGAEITVPGCAPELRTADEVVLEARIQVDGELAGQVLWLLSMTGEAATCEPAPAPPAWQTNAPLPYAVTENSAAAVGSMIYVLGGFVGLGVPADVWRYDVTADSWSAVAALPKPGYHHASLVVVDDQVFMVAALDGIGMTPVADVWAYDPVADAWTARTLAPIPRGAAAAVVIDNTIYVAAGVTDTGISNGLVSYDPALDTWNTDLPPLELAREHVAGCVLDGRFHVVGGRIGGLNNQDAHDVYDPIANAWTTAEPLPTPRSGIVAAVLDERCHVFGGEQVSGTFAEHEVLGPDGWITLEPMPTARHGLGAATVGNQIFVLGGGPEPGFAFGSANESWGTP